MIVEKGRDGSGRNAGNCGMTFVETLVSIGLMSIIFTAAVLYLAAAWRTVDFNTDKIFAIQKAISMLSEIQSFVENQAETISDLDDLDDGVTTSPLLTIARDITDPAHPASGNIWLENRWKYTRRITVRPMPNLNQRDSRFVTVRIFLTRPDGREIPLADVGSVMRTLADAYPTTQVYDIYLIAIENVPGWWVYMSYIKPFIEGCLSDIETRNPGLVFRRHWITTSAYGRDFHYTPYFNKSVPSTDRVDYVYFYPGTLPSGSPADQYYPVDRVRARINVDGQVVNDFNNDIDDPDYNPWPYPLADQWNNAMRAPEEWAYWVARARAWLTQQDPSHTPNTETLEELLARARTGRGPEPTLRMLYDDMIANPDNYKNAIFVNLHGEMVAMPPIRNYSDPAKDPRDHPGWRVVTHPERIWYDRDNPTEADVRLRVYAFTNPAPSAYYKWRTQGRPSILAPEAGVEYMDVPITIAIEGLKSTGSNITVQRITGGFDINPNDNIQDDYVLQTAPTSASVAGEMYYEIFYDGEHRDMFGLKKSAVIIKLYNTPLYTPEVKTDYGASANTKRGLRNTYSGQRWRLYNLEYIPCSCESGNNFNRNLTDNHARPKNTARWIITIPKDRLKDADSYYCVTTRIGDDLTTGVMYPPAQIPPAPDPDPIYSGRNKPENASRTYFWVTDSPEDVPFSERYQFIGDPRHCPYADLKHNGSGHTDFADGYNWYFDDFQDSSYNAISKWPGFDASRIKNDGSNSNDGWYSKSNYMEFDILRMFQMIREAMIRSESFYTAITGFSFYYMGIGNEIGYDSANAFPNGIPISRMLKDGASGWEYERQMSSLSGDNGVKLIKEANSGSYWWCMPWIGELYPDARRNSDGELVAACDGSNGINGDPIYQQWLWPNQGESDPDPNWVEGNLKTGSGYGHFRWIRRGNVSGNQPEGTDLKTTLKRTQTPGCTHFFNIEPGGNRRFRHHFKSGTYGSLTTYGQEIADSYYFPVPTSTKISRPFQLNTTYSASDGWNFPPYNNRNIGVVVKRFYGHNSSSAYEGSSLIALRSPDGSKTAYFMVNGIDRTTETGSAFISKYAILTLIHGFLVAGNPNDPNVPEPITQLPRCKIIHPTLLTLLDDPVTIDVMWRVEWCRWDGRKYTTEYPDDYEGDETDLRYVLMYSDDNGDTWKYMQDNSIATPGVLPPESESNHYVDDAGTGDETYTWDVSDTGRFPEASYLIRVDAFRKSIPMHYSYHIEKIYIDR